MTATVTVKKGNKRTTEDKVREAAKKSFFSGPATKALPTTHRA